MPGPPGTDWCPQQGLGVVDFLRQREGQRLVRRPETPPDQIPQAPCSASTALVEPEKDLAGLAIVCGNSAAINRNRRLRRSPLKDPNCALTAGLKGFRSTAPDAISQSGSAKSNQGRPETSDRLFLRSGWHRLTPRDNPPYNIIFFADPHPLAGVKCPLLLFMARLTFAVTASGMASWEDTGTGSFVLWPPVRSLPPFRERARWQN